MELCTVLKVQWEEEDRETYFQRHWPRLYNSSAFQRLRQAVLSTAFQWGKQCPWSCRFLDAFVSIGQYVFSCRCSAMR